MYILFLDIDGVLAPWNSGALDPTCVALLEELVTRAGAELVLTSSWREHTPLPVIERALRRAGLQHPLRGATPIYASEHRVAEIRAWLREHPEVACFVALDDEPLPSLEDHHVRTDDATGLVREDVERALQLFHSAHGGP